MTNYEKIKNMSIEEMVEYFPTADPYECPFSCPDCFYRTCDFDGDSCEIKAMRWLESEADE